MLQLSEEGLVHVGPTGHHGTPRITIVERFGWLFQC